MIKIIQADNISSSSQATSYDYEIEYTQFSVSLSGNLNGMHINSLHTVDSSFDAGGEIIDDPGVIKSDTK